MIKTVRGGGYVFTARVTGKVEDVPFDHADEEDAS